jgi:hypothetical protein
MDIELFTIEDHNLASGSTGFISNDSKGVFYDLIEITPLAVRNDPNE